MGTQQITVQAATKQPKEYNGETYWGVKVGNVWYDLYVNDRPAKGQTFNVDVTETESNGRTYRKARPVAGQQPAPSAPSQQQTRPAPVSSNGNRATPYTHSFDEYAAVARKAHGFARELEPGEGGARARTALVSTFLIAFGDGKLALPVEDEWGDVAGSGNGAATPTKYEKAAGHVHLEKTIWAYCERANLTADDAIAMLKEVSGKTDVLELSEKEAIVARLKAEKIIDEKTDYLALFTAEAKKIAIAEKWDFAGTDENTKAKKKALLIRAGINKAIKDLTNLDLKAALEQLTDDVSY